jgi:FkbM family methyltransferase
MVHSFEPSPDNFARLQAATADLPNVRANELAVSDITGEQLLYVSPVLNVDHRAYPVKGERRSTISVRSTRLDDYFKPNESIDLIKLDIQGYELHALRGAKRVLVDSPDIKLLFEFWPCGLRKAGSSPEALFTFLTQCGFTVFSLNKRGLNEYTQSDAPKEADGNYFDLFAQRINN